MQDCWRSHILEIQVFVTGGMFRLQIPYRVLLPLESLHQLCYNRQVLQQQYCGQSWRDIRHHLCSNKALQVKRLWVKDTLQHPESGRTSRPKLLISLAAVLHSKHLKAFICEGWLGVSYGGFVQFQSAQCVQLQQQRAAVVRTALSQITKRCS